MKRTSGLLGTVVIVGGCLLGLVACSSETQQDRLGFASHALTVWNSHGEARMLRVGESLSLEALQPGALDPDAKYTLRVAPRGGDALVQASLLTTLDGRLPLATVMHDVGEFDPVRPGTTLDITLTSPTGQVMVDSLIVTAREVPRQGAGWDVAEASPPHLYAATVTGTPANSFAVGHGRLAEGEVGGEVYAAGDGFPANATFDIYVVRDRDIWAGEAIPQAGDPDYIAGPVTVTSDAEGRLAPTPTGFIPDMESVGVYDLLADLDGNGLFDWGFSQKDGADGEHKVGHTVQLSRAWLEERTSKHILVNLAFDNKSRSSGTWRNEYTAGEPVYMYLNPPVKELGCNHATGEKGQFHAKATKWVVKHQDWETFWNSQRPEDNVGGASGYGQRDIRSIAISDVEYKPQNGCTNSPPLITFNAKPGEYDMVIDFDSDGFYDIGHDMLDVYSGDNGGFLVDPADLLALPRSQRVGFSVK